MEKRHKNMNLDDRSSQTSEKSDKLVLKRQSSEKMSQECKFK